MSRKRRTVAVPMDALHRLIWVGDQMANVAHNLRQMSTRVPDPADRKMLDELWRQWDEAVRAPRRSLIDSVQRRLEKLGPGHGA